MNYISNRCCVKGEYVDKEYLVIFLSECEVHCSLCYNETECYECTQGYFLTASGECQSK